MTDEQLDAIIKPIIELEIGPIVERQVRDAFQRIRGDRRRTVSQPRTLKDETSRTLADVDYTEVLSAANLKPGEFHEQLRKRNAAYDSFCKNAETGEDFARQAKEAGQQLTEQFYRPPRDCRPSLRRNTADQGEDWVDAVNRRGRELRNG